jgi:hypothetical protein
MERWYHSNHLDMLILITSSIVWCGFGFIILIRLSPCRRYSTKLFCSFHMHFLFLFCPNAMNMPLVNKHGIHPYILLVNILFQFLELTSSLKGESQWWSHYFFKAKKNVKIWFTSFKGSWLSSILLVGWKLCYWFIEWVLFVWGYREWNSRIF